MCGASVPALTQKIKNMIFKNHVLSEISIKHLKYLPSAHLYLLNPRVLQLQAVFCSETEFDIRCACLSPSVTQMMSGRFNVLFFCS